MVATACAKFYVAPSTIPDLSSEELDLIHALAYEARNISDTHCHRQTPSGWMVNLTPAQTR